jgi:hypothetical protein
LYSTTRRALNSPKRHSSNTNWAFLTSGVSASPSRFMNAAIARRETVSVGQYSVVDVQPVVMARFFSHSTFGQIGLVWSTSVNPAQSAARAGVEEAGVANAARAAATYMRGVMEVSLTGR